MRKIAKLISLSYGYQMLFASLGMALYCYLALNAFRGLGKESGVNLRLLLLAAVLVFQVGLGLLMIWLGMPSQNRMRMWRIIRNAFKQIIEN